MIVWGKVLSPVWTSLLSIRDFTAGDRESVAQEVGVEGELVSSPGPQPVLLPCAVAYSWENTQ